MAIELTGSVGRSPAGNAPTDVTLVQAFMGAFLASIKSPQLAMVATWLPGVFAPTLGDAIVLFQRKRVLPVADGRIDKNGRTWREMLLVAKQLGIPEFILPPPPPPPPFTDLKVLRFQQTMPGQPVSLVFPSIEPASVMPFTITPIAKSAVLTEGSPTATVTEFLFKILKNGATFWVGACVPSGTMDFSRAYVYFHPDTISGSDDAAYPGFTGRWPTVQRYCIDEGLQMAAIKKMPLIVPFMTNASRANSSQTNLFADRGVETLNDILSAIQISLGQTSVRASVQKIGVASFSSGIDHLFRFAQKLGGSGLIREQIDFDSAFMRVPHKNAPTLAGAVTWMVTQSPPPPGKRIGWLHLPATAFRNINTMRGDTHTQIGFMMFRTMMVLSAIR